MACTAPPPSPTTLRMELVKKVRSKRAMPLPITEMTSDTSGSRARTKALVTRVVASRSWALRLPSTMAEAATMMIPYTTRVTASMRITPNEPARANSDAATTRLTASTTPLVHAGSWLAVSLLEPAGRVATAADISSLPRTLCAAR